MKLTPFNKKFITEDDVAAHIWAVCEPSFLAEIINKFAKVTGKNADTFLEVDEVAQETAKHLNEHGLRFVRTMSETRKGQ